MECINNNYLHRSENIINSHLSRIGNKVNEISQHSEIKSVNTNSNEILDAIQSLKNELTSPMIKENELYKELFSDDEKYDRIADLALLSDMENVRRDFEEEVI